MYERRWIYVSPVVLWGGTGLQIEQDLEEEAKNSTARTLTSRPSFSPVGG